MKDDFTPLMPGAGARDLPAANGLRAFFMWEGRPVPMVLERGAWRARKRSKGLTVDVGTGTGDLILAKKIVRESLERRKVSGKAAGPSGDLEEVAQVYLKLPKRVSPKVALENVARWRSVVKVAWGKSLKEARQADLPGLWPAYVAARQGGAVPDYNKRQACNAGINSAMRMARSILLESLRPGYEAAGIRLPADAANVIWCAELTSPRPQAEDEALVQAWRELPVGSSLWWVVGLARFAGLRRSEILAARGGWVLERAGAVYVELRDRPEESYWNKTGGMYSPLVMDGQLAEALRVASRVRPEARLVVEPDAHRWIERAPQLWLKPFIGAARLPLHRLRGLYADQVRREMEEAILARQAGTKAASVALGHSGTAVTEKSYLSR